MKTCMISAEVPQDYLRIGYLVRMAQEVLTRSRIFAVLS